MDIQQPLTLLGGLSPERFMKTYWHKKPLLIRQAIPGFQAFLSRKDLVEMAAREDVESRLIVHGAKGWSLKHGPLARRSLPPFTQKKWTFLVQGVDLHDDRAHDLLQQFRFVPDARLDDLMISYATDGGGVGPHFDSYDVFLLQAHGKRRWRIGRQKDLSLQEGVPLKILDNFVPEEEFVLEPGDMLYLPPKWAHDGIAEGECMTWSIGFRSPNEAELAAELVSGLAQEAVDLLGETMYRDPKQVAVTQPAAMPAQLQDFAAQAVRKLVNQPQWLQTLLGEYMTQAKSGVWFDGEGFDVSQGVALDRRTRMMYDKRQIYINGDSFRVGGADGRLLRQLADQRQLGADKVAKLSPDAQAALQDWADNGWLKTL